MYSTSAACRRSLLDISASNRSRSCLYISAHTHNEGLTEVTCVRAHFRGEKSRSVSRHRKDRIEEVKTRVYKCTRLCILTDREQVTQKRQDHQRGRGNACMHECAWQTHLERLRSCEVEARARHFNNSKLEQVTRTLRSKACREAWFCTKFKAPGEQFALLHQILSLHV